MVTSSPSFRGPKRGRNGCVTPHSGVPNAKHRKKIKSVYLTHAFSSPKSGLN